MWSQEGKLKFLDESQERLEPQYLAEFPVDATVGWKHLYILTLIGVKILPSTSYK